MEIKQLKYFIEVAKREHLSEAALELDIAQSAISRQITQLEEELQVTLFKREGRNIYLTDSGKQLFSEATKIIEQLDETKRLFHEQSRSNHYIIRIGYVESYISQVLTLLIQSFENKSESIIEPILMEEGEIISSLLTDQIDIGFTDLTNDIKQNQRLKTNPLFEENYHIYAPKDDPITMATNPPLVQFSTKSIYELYPLPNNIRQTLSNIVEKPIRTVTHPQLAQYLLNHERGYIITATYHFLERNPSKWVDIPLNHTELKRTICSVMRKDNRKNDIQLMQSTIEQLLSRSATYH
ncbi:LysR family transcriptional regulator [Staphylococcus gallinarum]|uniref:LysR family transcriptional regulator n=1 Tax=Staphylococcus gallinarum TaxID=1293 RepID=A0A2T4SWN6_STAGA|nr:LysR family transcriptional regulator [Staphylococcus gallinarum]MCD8820844.1 LysR family transcriptional regulator [Staphylococcus gallinarum]MCD8827779.1 LysR family transcriptional regulator [Staphylococcus gallinarum]MCD8871377.1 LysR family transcriptional regulator [Staphylococcus gallinarum]MCQ9288375.1 LysR family transcriptional regulator [Staphylococcus gallinarum]MCW0986387.1 LysR family transcriptional regulator [Staphylococcus gallinarum]